MSQDRPTAAELVRAVRDFLKTQMLDKLEGSAQFQTRVSINVLAIVARELELGPALDRAEQARLEQLLGIEGSLTELQASLARGIRDGSLDDRRDAVMEHVRQTVREKLEVAHPGYAE